MSSHRDYVVRASVIGLVAIWLAAFCISYVSLMQVAVENGIGLPWAWLYPFLLDAFMTIASLDVVRREMDGEPTRMAWGLVVIITAVSTIFNMTRADPSILSYSVHALAPIVCFASFEVTMGTLRVNFRKAATEEAADAITNGADTRAKVLSIYSNAPDSTYTAVAEMLGISRQTIAYHVERLKKGGELPPRNKT